MEINDKLFTLKKDFSLWRSKRKRGTPVPNELKERACSLLRLVNEVYKPSDLVPSTSSNVLVELSILISTSISYRWEVFT